MHEEGDKDEKERREDSSNGRTSGDMWRKIKKRGEGLGGDHREREGDAWRRKERSWRKMKDLSCE